MPLPSNPSPKLAVVSKWLTAFDNFKLDEVFNLTTDDMTMTLGPASLGDHKMDREALTTYFNNQISTSFNSATSTVLDVIESADRIWIHGKSVTAPSNTEHEYNATFDFVGEKIKVVKVFLDASKTAELRLDEREKEAAEGRALQSLGV